jgi:predicted nucleic acid-binding protein
MKDGFVADSSVGVAWAVFSQASEATSHLLNEVASGTPLVIPGLWTLEVANALLVLTRRKRIDADQCARARRALGRLNPRVDEEGPRLALGKLSELAEKHALSIYDAVYLELALRRRLPLASRDAALNHAAQICGVRTLL